MRKTAYEVRISDWSSDVCSSDLPLPAAFFDANGADGNIERGVARRIDPAHGAGIDAARDGSDRIDDLHRPNLGRAGDRPAGEEDAQHLDRGKARRSEERRVGKECVRTCRSRVSP